jgi:hypothetical protein
MFCQDVKMIIILELYYYVLVITSMVTLCVGEVTVTVVEG